MMPSFYSSLRLLSNEGCKSYRPLHPQSLTPLLFFLLRTSKSTKRVGEAATLSTMCPHTHVSTPEYSRGITTYTLYYLSIHDVYSVLSEYTRRILTLPPRCIPNRRIPMYTHPQIFPIGPNPSLRHSYKCKFLPLPHSEVVIKSGNMHKCWAKVWPSFPPKK